MITELTDALIAPTTKLVKQYSEDIGFGEYFSFPSAAQRLQGMTLCFLYLKDNEVKGIIGGSIGFSPWNSRVRILQEDIFYLHKDCRKGMTGSKLLTRYLDEIDNVNAQMFTMKTMIDSPKSVDKIYGKYGFTGLETTYVRK